MASAFHPSIFLGIHTDGAVYIVAHRSEMGNGVRTSLPRILADELDADWSRVKVVQAMATRLTARRIPMGRTLCANFLTRCAKPERRRG